MRILLWHARGPWAASFTRGPHDYVAPATSSHVAGPGRPEGLVECAAEDLRDLDLDVVVLQQPHEAEVVERWTGRRPGRDVPAVYVEHHTPQGGPTLPCAEHPMAHRNDVLLAHVTAFNELFWDNGRAPTVVVEHGVADPGQRATGELARAVSVIDDPARRGRVVGADLLGPLAATRPLDLMGVRVERLSPTPGLRLLESPTREQRLAEAARRRVYVHTARWGSLGVPMIEAMMLGLPVVAVAAAETAVAVPPAAGAVTTSRAALLDAVARLVDDVDAALTAGAAAREHALGRWGLERFLREWDDVLARVVADRRGSLAV